MENEEELTPEEEKLLRLWIKSNKEVLQNMFNGTLLEKNSIKIIKQYFKAIEIALEEDAEQRRYLRTHSSIVNDIVEFFELMEWDVGTEIPIGDLDSSYRFDVMVEKGKNTIIVEVKPEITTREMGQVIGYIHDIEKKSKNARVFLGTDLFNYDTVFGEGEVGDIVFEHARNHELGIILINKDNTFLIPAELIIANFQK